MIIPGNRFSPSATTISRDGNRSERHVPGSAAASSGTSPPMRSRKSFDMNSSAMSSTRGCAERKSVSISFGRSRLFTGTRTAPARATAETR